MHVHWEAEVGRQVTADLLPGFAGVVATHHVPVLLHKEHARAGAVHCDAVNAVANLGRWVGNAFGAQAAVYGPPGLAGVVGAEHARGGDSDEHPPGVARIKDDGVQAHPTRAWLPGRPGRVAAQPGKLLPRATRVRRTEQGSVFRPGIDGVRIGQRRFEMPDALELPGMRRAVIPLVCNRDASVGEFVTDRLPRLAPVTGALDHLSEPAAGLRRIQPVRVNGRPLEMINLPAPKVGTADIPPLATAVRGHDERALARANQ